MNTSNLKIKYAGDIHIACIYISHVASKISGDIHIACIYISHVASKISFLELYLCS